MCHVETYKSLQPGTPINGGTYTVSTDIGDKLIHPYSLAWLFPILVAFDLTRNGNFCPGVAHFADCPQALLAFGID
jgi:hypothetical protein